MIAQSLAAQSKESLQALVSPVRSEILVALDSLGPSSVRRIAQTIGRRPSSLYYHLEHLERFGWVAIHETRHREGHSEVIYRLARGQRLASQPGEDRQSRQLLGQIGAALMRQTAREFRIAAAAGECGSENPVQRFKVRLGDRARASIAEHLRAIEALVREESQATEPGGQLCSLTFALLPVVEASGSEETSRRPAPPGAAPGSRRSRTLDAPQAEGRSRNSGKGSAAGPPVGIQARTWVDGDPSPAQDRSQPSRGGGVF